MTRHRVLQTPAFEQLVEELTDIAADGVDNIRRRPSEISLGAALWWLDREPTSSSIDNSKNSSPYTLNAFAPEPEQLPLELPVDPESIANELGLKPGLTAQQIAALRRTFARRNHPDRFPSQIQNNATERMMVANALCDAYPLKPFKF